MARKRKFADGGETPALDRLASGEDTGSFDTGTYARAKRFLERGGEEEKPAPKRAAKKKTPPPSSPPAESKPKTSGVFDMEPKTHKVLSTKGLNPKTLLPDSSYAKGGKVRGGGIESKGKTRGKFV